MQEEYQKLFRKYTPKYIRRLRRLIINFFINFNYYAKFFYYRIKFYPLIIRTGTSDIEVFKKIFINREYDIAYSLRPKLIIDGGANVGYASVFFANRFPKAEIFAIEPETSNFEVLTKNILKYNKIHPIKKGLWHKKGHLKIIDSGIGKWGFMTKEVTLSEPYDVEVITINDILIMTNYDEIDILKLDIEGAEKEIFSENYDYWLGKVNILFIELHDRMKEGCSKAFYSAIKKYNFKQTVSGENIILTKVK